VQPIRRTRNEGFTLLEVLVALVVLSIGLLGIGKLVLFSARGNDSAYLRSQATALAYSIIDDMRANRAEAEQAAYIVPLGAYGGGGNCVDAACTSATLATYDLAGWKAQMAQALPQGDGTVTTTTVVNPATGTNETTAVVTVQWNDQVAQSSFGAANNTVVITLETIL
jgi:type IV pilus assembly protein PilV